MKREMILLNYGELKEFLKKNPFCFQPMNDRRREFDRRVSISEKKPITFVEAAAKKRDFLA